MDDMHREHYEERFNRLLERGELLHESNKKRIRIALALLVIFTLGMIFVRLITDSDRATFLIIWVLGMFVICIYLIAIEYIDSEIEKTLEEVTQRDAGWDDLILDPQAARERMQDRIEDRRNEVKGRLNERRSELKDMFQTRRDLPRVEIEEEDEE